MKIALTSKNKLGFVDGTFVRTARAPDLINAWDRCNAVVLSWLINSVDKEISCGITFCENAHLIWMDLKERFDKSDGSKIFNLHHTINSFTQGSLPVSTYSKLKELWHEFGGLVVIPTCNCQASKE